MKRYMSAFLIPCLLLYLTGCYSMQPVLKDTIRNESFHGDLQVVTTEGKSYKFKADDYTIVEDSIKGKGIQSGMMKGTPDKDFQGSIALLDTKDLVAEQFDVKSTVFLGILTAGIITLIVISMSDFKPLGDGPLFEGKNF